MKKSPLATILSIVFIDLIGFGMIIPILPLYAAVSSERMADRLSPGVLFVHAISCRTPAGLALGQVRTPSDSALQPDRIGIWLSPDGKCDQPLDAIPCSRDHGCRRCKRRHGLRIYRRYYAPGKSVSAYWADRCRIWGRLRPGARDRWGPEPSLGRGAVLVRRDFGNIKCPGSAGLSTRAGSSGGGAQRRSRSERAVRGSRQLEAWGPCRDLFCGHRGVCHCDDDLPTSQRPPVSAEPEPDQLYFCCDRADWRSDSRWRDWQIVKAFWGFESGLRRACHHGGQHGRYAAS